MKYRAVYKCRLCGKVFTTSNGYFFTDDIKNDAKIELFMARMCIQVHGNNLPYEHHVCDNGDVGFGDLLGLRKVSEE